MYRQRIEKVLGRMEAAGLTQLIVSDPESIRYLTGADIRPGERLLALYLAKDKTPALFLNRLFRPEEDVPCEEVWYADADAPVEWLAERVDAAQTLGVDKDWPARFLLPLLEKRPGMRAVLGSDCVDTCRACKDEDEQNKMRAASCVNDQVMQKTARFLKVGVTEKEVARFIESEYAKVGCEAAFPTIVCFGANAADPHHAPDDTRLEDETCVLIDMGCRKDGYCADMTRTFCCGKAAEEFLAVHDLVRKANEAAEDMIRPGVKLSDVDAAARTLIAEAGYGPNFTHRLGHFIGQTVHEKGDVSAASELVAEEGMVFSVEPGVYLPGRFGVRIEDLVLVTADGCEVLNRVDKHCRSVG